MDKIIVYPGTVKTADPNYVRDTESTTERKVFDLNYKGEDVEEFLLHNKVEVLVQEDGQYHCYINYKGDGKDYVWYSTIHNPLTAIVIGIKKYKQAQDKKQNEKI